MDGKVQEPQQDHDSSRRATFTNLHQYGRVQQKTGAARRPSALMDEYQTGPGEVIQKQTITQVDVVLFSAFERKNKEYIARP